MDRQQLYKQAIDLKDIEIDDALALYEKAPLHELMLVADTIRRKLHPENKVGWIIDRNVNITNVCISQCKFCNFCRVSKDDDSYITSLELYREKIKETLALGGEQLLLQGGLHPQLGIEYYEELFNNLKKEFPKLKLHALGPPEVVYLAKKAGLSYGDVIRRLIDAGLDSLPGAGAEILSDRVRSEISPAKANTAEWLNAMHAAHVANIPTSATMMFGHIETERERMEHLLLIRNLQNKKPEGTYGFLSFIPWPFQDSGTVLKEKKGVLSQITALDYIRLISISRILLNNISNIQASWLTVGAETASLCLHAGANDMGSIMIEENVVSSAGANNVMNADDIRNIIIRAGYSPYHRNQRFEDTLGF